MKSLPLVLFWEPKVFTQVHLYSLLVFYSRWWNDGRIKAALKQACLLQLCHRIFPIHPLFTGVHFPIQQRPLIHENLTHMSCMRSQELFMKVGVSESHAHPADHLVLSFCLWMCHCWHNFYVIFCTLKKATLNPANRDHIKYARILHLHIFLDHASFAFPLALAPSLAVSFFFFSLCIQGGVTNKRNLRENKLFHR